MQVVSVFSQEIKEKIKNISYRPGWSQKQPKQVIYLYNTLSQHSMATYKFALSLKFFKRNFKATRSKVNDSSSSSSKLGPLLTDLEIPKTLFGGQGDPRHTTNKHSTYIISSRNIT